jgi:hypothetical protein
MHAMPHSRAHGCLFATWSQITQKLSDMEMSALFGTTKLRLKILVALLLIHAVYLIELIII